MSVIKMQSNDSPTGPQSGGAMDRVVERKGLSRNVKIGVAAAAVLLAALLFYLAAPSANSQTVAAERLTISTVTKGRFDDFLPLRARVTPLVTVYLDAVEGGRVGEGAGRGRRAGSAGPAPRGAVEQRPAAQPARPARATCHAK
jgi:HlyD family secretion protein